MNEFGGIIRILLYLFGHQVMAHMHAWQASNMKLQFLPFQNIHTSTLRNKTIQIVLVFLKKYIMYMSTIRPHNKIFF